MDGSAFDRLARAFVRSGSRRRLLGVLTGLPFAGLVSGGEAVAKLGRKTHRHRAQHQHRHAKTQRRKDQRKVAHATACIPTGQRCPSKKPRGKHAKKLGCNQCCQGSFVTDASGKKVCGCQPNGGPCTTATATSCCSGFCNGTTCQAAPCSAAIPCPQCQTCNASTGLCEAVADGTACDDGNACTQTDTCQGGVCVGTDPVVCTALDQCHVAGVCDPATGLCSNPAKPDGSACNDGDACTQTDTCQSGVCAGSNPVVCTPLDQCHVAGICNPATGLCSNPTKPDDTGCDDGDLCTTGETCQGGVCMGGTPVANRTSCGGSNLCCNGTCCSGCCSTSAATGGTCGACRVFVSSALHNGNLGGLSGADGICQTLANAAPSPLPGSYKAWLSTEDQQGPSNRFRQSQQPYVLVDAAGTQIAANWADLTNGNIDHAINVNETGATVASSFVWTNTNPFGGTPNSCPTFCADCGGWINGSSGLGAEGDTTQSGSTWSDVGSGGCQFSDRRLYCFQQD